MPSGTLSNIVAHAALGCGAAGLTGKDCASGAIGAASAAALNPLLDGLTSSENLTLRNAQLAALSSLTSGVIARTAGAEVGTAIGAAQNETLNNYLSSSQKSQRLQELASCTDALCRTRVGTKWILQDKLQDGGLAVGFGGGLGLGAYRDAQGVVEGLGALVGQPGETLAALRAFIDDPEVRQRAGNAFFADYEQRLDTLQRAYEDAGWQGSVTAGVETGRLLWDAAAIASGIGAGAKLTAKVGAFGGRAAAAAMEDFVVHAGARGQVGAAGVSQAAIRSRVEANLAESAKSRLASAFDIHLAKTDQIRWGYAPDQWEMTRLSAGDKVYGGLPGQSSYYTSLSTLESSAGSRSTLFQSLQVKAHPEFGYRPKVGEYKVMSDVAVPSGTVTANPGLGVGGGDQYFIRNYKDTLQLVREVSLKE